MPETCSLPPVLRSTRRNRLNERPNLIRIGRGIYTPDPGPMSRREYIAHMRRAHIRATSDVLGGRGVLRGLAAAAAYGAQIPEFARIDYSWSARDCSPIGRIGTTRFPAKLRMRRSGVPHLSVRGLNVPPPEHVVADIARWEGPLDAVIAISAFLRQILEWDEAPRYRGEQLASHESDLKQAACSLLSADTESCRKARRIVSLCSGACESYPEREMLWFFAAWGFPPPQLQRRVSSAQGQTMYPDFSWPEYRIIVEFDGHSKFESPFETERFIRRDNVAALEGWKVFHVTWTMLQDRRGLAAALAQLFPYQVRRRIGFRKALG